MKNIMWTLFVASIFLSGCASIDSSETLDQLGHFEAGKLIACDASRWVSPQEAVDHTMAFARTREERSIPANATRVASGTLRLGSAAQKKVPLAN